MRTPPGRKDVMMDAQILVLFDYSNEQENRVRLRRLRVDGCPMTVRTEPGAR